MKELSEVLCQHKKEPSSLIPILQEVQGIFGYVPKESLKEIAKYLKIPPSKVYGVVTFYSQFRFTKLGKYAIKVCHGTACHVGGVQKMREALLDELKINLGETTKDGLFSVERVACLGCCSLAPCMMINDRVYGRLTRNKVRKIIKEYRKRG
jgi:NADH-quinone oxidoreductase subunit E